MEILVVVALVVWLGISFLKGNTKRGVETVRAHVFLGGLAAGASLSEANAASMYDVAGGPTEVIQSAMAHLNIEYGGKQSAMISDAYRKGMIPKLPFWYRTIVVRTAAA